MIVRTAKSRRDHAVHTESVKRFCMVLVTHDGNIHRSAKVARQQHIRRHAKVSNRVQIAVCRNNGLAADEVCDELLAHRADVDGIVILESCCQPPRYDFLHVIGVDAFFFVLDGSHMIAVSSKHIYTVYSRRDLMNCLGENF